MGRTAQERADFETAMGEAFSDAVCPPVPFEDASPHECCEAVRAALGAEVTPDLLVGLSQADLAALARSFGTHFEVPPPTIAQIETGLAATLSRWPATRRPG